MTAEDGDREGRQQWCLVLRQNLFTENMTMFNM